MTRKRGIAGMRMAWCDGRGTGGKRLVLAAIWISLSGMSTSAQEPAVPETEMRLGSRIPWRIDRPTPTQAEATRVLYRFGTCTVEAKPEDSAQLLRLSIRQRGQMAIVSRLVGTNNRCLVGAQQMSLNLEPFRGSIANALYLRDYPVFPADRLPMAPERAGEMLTGDPKSVLPDFARCIVRSDPARVDALLRTRPASDDEHEALLGLSGSFPACLFQGQALEANTLTLRSILADAAYGLSLAEGTPAIAR